MRLSFKLDSDKGTIEVYADGRYLGDISKARAGDLSDQLEELSDGERDSQDE